MNSVDMINKSFQNRMEALVALAGNQQKGIHNFMVDLFKSTIEQGADWQYFNALFNKLGKGTNKRAITDWVHTFTPLRWNKEKGEFIRAKKHKWDIISLNEGSRNPFYSWDKPKQERAEATFSEEKKYASLKKAVEKMIAEFNTAQADTALLQSILDSLN